MNQELYNIDNEKYLRNNIIDEQAFFATAEVFCKEFPEEGHKQRQKENVEDDKVFI